ncbi:MAG: SPOR domain-containing protein [Flavobacteriales bacterium]|nr:SPOR domain-containing protein [Flavobacteriales bacterium]
MKLEQYISELLYKYDCVIVPGLGGFVANYKSATIQPIQNTFSPPSKSISFNKNLNNNDGLLANLIAQKENINFNVANKKIEDYVLTISHDLKLKKRVLLKDVGTLFLDTENRTQFEPADTVNYLLSSFGLSVFQKQPIKRATIEEKITKEFKNRTTPLTVVKNGKSSSTKWKFAAAIAIPLAFLAGWMPTQYDLTGDLTYANLNPFKPTEKAIYTPTKSEFVFNDVKESTVKEQMALADENTYFLEISFDKNETPIIVQLKEKPIAEAVSTYVSSSIRDLKYHIIGGCFSSKNNARKMVRKLKKAGFEASIVGQRKGLWTVSYNSFATRKEAVSALADAQDHNTKAWVLKQSF